MKMIAVILAMMLTGCAAMDQIVCTGTGTCAATGRSSQAAAYTSPLPQTIITGQGTYMIIRSQSTGQIQSLIPVSGAK